MDYIMGLDIRWAAIIITELLILVLILIITISNSFRISKLIKKYEKFTKGYGEVDIETLVGKCIEKTNKITEKNKEIENQINKIERNMIHCIQKVGIVRFNAFDNVGSELSFSVALLDANDDGVVISGIYSRDNSTAYAKPITKANSKYALSAEEIKAIDEAKKIHRQMM